MHGARVAGAGAGAGAEGQGGGEPGSLDGYRDHSNLTEDKLTAGGEGKEGEGKRQGQERKELLARMATSGAGSSMSTTDPDPAARAKL